MSKSRSATTTVKLNLEARTRLNIITEQVALLTEAFDRLTDELEALRNDQPSLFTIEKENT